MTTCSMLLLVLASGDPASATEKLPAAEVEQVLKTWTESVFEFPRQSVKFIYRIENPEFGTIREFRGYYVVDSAARWTIRVWEREDQPVSALAPRNKNRSPQTDLFPSSIIRLDNQVGFTPDDVQPVQFAALRETAEALSPTGESDAKAQLAALSTAASRAYAVERSRQLRLRRLCSLTEKGRNRLAGVRLANGVLAIKALPSVQTAANDVGHAFFMFATDSAWPFWVESVSRDGLIIEKVSFFEEDLNRDQAFRSEDYRMDVSETAIKIWAERFPESD